MKHIIDVETWKRKEHFHFFNSMSDPFTGIVANVDCTKAKNTAKELGASFWLYYLHKSLAAVNQIEAFRYRIDEKGRVICYDRVHAGTTIDTVAGTFSFAFLNYRENFSDFEKDVSPKIETIRVMPGMNFDDDARRDDCIHYTSLPWISFTSLKHARNEGMKASCPKISFGKYFEERGRLLLPVSVEVNHALMDGREMGEYYECFQDLLNS